MPDQDAGVVVRGEEAIAPDQIARLPDHRVGLAEITLQGGARLAQQGLLDRAGVVDARQQLAVLVLLHVGQALQQVEAVAVADQILAAHDQEAVVQALLARRGNQAADLAQRGGGVQRHRLGVHANSTHDRRRNTSR